LTEIKQEIVVGEGGVSMNFIHLKNVFDGKNSAEIYELLVKAGETYIDTEEGTLTNEFSRKKIVISDGKSLDLDLIKRQIITNRDLYENSITSLSWKNLDRYLDILDTVQDMEHAAFIIDIASRNCIPLQAKLYTDMLRFRQRNIYIQYRQSWLNKDIKDIHAEAHEQIFKVLNILVYRDAYVRY
jgi:hypothetical protein